jgi:hypothetical protein
MSLGTVYYPTAYESLDKGDIVCFFHNYKKDITYVYKTLDLPEVVNEVGNKHRVYGVVEDHSTKRNERVRVITRGIVEVNLYGTYPTQGTGVYLIRTFNNEPIYGCACSLKDYQAEPFILSDLTTRYVLSLGEIIPSTYNSLNKDKKDGVAVQNVKVLLNINNKSLDFINPRTVDELPRTTIPGSSVNYHDVGTALQTGMSIINVSEILQLFALVSSGQFGQTLGDMAYSIHTLCQGVFNTCTPPPQNHTATLMVSEINGQCIYDSTSSLKIYDQTNVDGVLTNQVALIPFNDPQTGSAGNGFPLPFAYQYDYLYSYISDPAVEAEFLQGKFSKNINILKETLQAITYGIGFSTNFFPDTSGSYKYTVCIKLPVETEDSSSGNALYFTLTWTYTAPDPEPEPLPY